MKKTIILTYSINVDGMNGEEAFKFVDDMKKNVALTRADFPSDVNVLVQYVPIHNSSSKFQVDVIEA